MDKIFISGKISRDAGFLVQLLFRIFYFAERISLFFWLRRGCKILWTQKNEKLILNPDTCSKLKTPIVQSYAFVEAWTLGNMLMALILSLILRNGMHMCHIMLQLVAVYAVLRIFEMFIYQFNVLFFHRLNADYVLMPNAKTDRLWRIFVENHKSFPVGQYAIKSATRTVLSLIINMMEYVLLFDVLFACITLDEGAPYDGANTVNSFLLFMSIEDVQEISSVSSWLVTVAEIEIFFGIFINLICLGRFIGLLPEVQQMSK